MPGQLTLIELKSLKIFSLRCGIQKGWDSSFEIWRIRVGFGVVLGEGSYRAHGFGEFSAFCNGPGDLNSLSRDHHAFEVR